MWPALESANAPYGLEVPCQKGEGDEHMMGPAAEAHGRAVINVDMVSEISGETLLRHVLLVLVRPMVVDRTFRFYSARTEHLRQTVRCLCVHTLGEESTQVATATHTRSVQDELVYLDQKNITCLVVVWLCHN